MMSEQQANRTETAQEIVLMLRTDDGTTYVIPHRALSQYRLPVDQAAELKTQSAAGDVEGFYYGPSANVGTFGGAVPVGPGAGNGRGFSALLWLPAHYATNTNRDNPNGYRPLVR